MSAMPLPVTAMPLLSVEGLTVIDAHTGRRLVQGVDLTLHAGQTLCMVGESGSGKTLAAMSIAGLLPAGVHASGSVRLADAVLSVDAPATTRAQRVAGMGVVFQNPSVALNPRLTIGAQLAEALPADVRRRPAECASACMALLEEVGMPEPLRKLAAWPHELSGGQAQRVVIAMALARRPQLLIADEPTTALDVTVQAQILDLIATLQARHAFGVLLITHDMGVVRDRADEVVVMAGGSVVERGAAATFFAGPCSPEARALLQAAILPLPSDAAGETKTEARPALVEAIALHKRFGSGAPALQDVSLRIAAGQTVGIVGESGSGKTTLARILAGLARQDAGQVRVQGALRAPGRRSPMVQYVFQDPYASLDPRISVELTVAEPLLAQGVERSRALAEARTLLAEVSLDASLWQRLPVHLSGGQRQRVGIARALASHPGLLIADEPVAALDMSVRGRILALLAQVQQRRGMAQLIISHDLAVIARLCSHIVVMRRGSIVEQGPTLALLAAPTHPYTRQLFDAMPGRLPRPGIAPLVTPHIHSGE